MRPLLRIFKFSLLIAQSVFYSKPQLNPLFKIPQQEQTRFHRQPPRLASLALRFCGVSGKRLIFEEIPSIPCRYKGETANLFILHKIALPNRKKKAAHITGLILAGVL